MHNIKTVRKLQLWNLANLLEEQVVQSPKENHTNEKSIVNESGDIDVDKIRDDVLLP